MKVALIEVKSQDKDYIAKEMAGGLGKRLRLKNTFFGNILNHNLKLRFNAPPIILAQISGILRAHNQEVLSYYTSSVTDIDKDIDFCIVLSSMVDYKNEVNFINNLKSLYPNLKIVIVGSFASAMPDIYKSSDFIIIGSPELAIIEIVTKGFPREQIIYSREPENLNELPVIDWSPFIRNKLFAFRPFSKDRGISIQKSRGCSMSCNYCPYAAFYGKVKQFENAYVIKIIKYYYENYNIKYFMFRDPNFGENKSGFRRFMSELIMSALKISWSCEARLDTFSLDDLELMHKAGLRYIIVGIESSNEKLLNDNLRQGFSKQDVLQKIRLLERLGVTVQTNYIIGYPHETKDSVLDTIKYAKILNSMFASFHLFTPQPGTQIFEDYRHKFLTSDWQCFNYSQLVWKHDTLSKDFLEGVLHNAYIRYYFRPKWVIKHCSYIYKLFFR